MNPTSLFELMQTSSVVDRTQSVSTPTAQPHKTELFTDDVLALISYEREITRLEKAYKFTVVQVNPLAMPLYRMLRDQHHTHKRKATMVVEWTNPKYRTNAIRDAKAYIAHIQKLKNSSNAKIRHNDAIQNYLAKTDCQLERLVRGLEDSFVTP